MFTFFSTEVFAWESHPEVPNQLNVQFWMQISFNLKKKMLKIGKTKNYYKTFSSQGIKYYIIFTHFYYFYFCWFASLSLINQLIVEIFLVLLNKT